MAVLMLGTITLFSIFKKGVYGAPLGWIIMDTEYMIRPDDRHILRILRMMEFVKTIKDDF